MPLDYETLRVIWWALMGILLIGFALTDGFDLGVGSLLPFVGHSDLERRQIINTIGATWEGNQVWLVLGGGAIFAAWPFVYAISFSGFYLAMFVVLAALIVRPVAFKFRSERPDPLWRQSWDWAIFVGSFVPALVFGVAVGNVLTGVPFRLDENLRTTLEGGFLDLFTPFTLLAGLVSVSMLVLHGAGWLAMKLEPGAVRTRAIRFGTYAALAAFVLYAIGGVWFAYGDMGYVTAGLVDPNGPSNPLRTSTVVQAGAWLENYASYPLLLTLPILGLLGPLIALAGIRKGKDWLVFTGSSAANIGIIGSVGASMFPFILPSSIDPQSSLTVWNASSSHLTLFVMLIATAVFLPLILIYTGWAYKIMFGRVGEDEVARNPDLY